MAAQPAVRRRRPPVVHVRGLADEMTARAPGPVDSRRRRRRLLLIACANVANFFCRAASRGAAN
jgi:hypothetical protein